MMYSFCASKKWVGQMFLCGYYIPDMQMIVKFPITKHTKREIS